MENSYQLWPMVSIENPAFNLIGGPLKVLTDISGGVPLLILLVSLFAFCLISLTLLYHWLKYGKGSINRFLVIITYFGGALIFFGTAWTAALSI